MLGCCFRRTPSTGYKYSHLLYDIGVTYLPECYCQNFNNMGINSIDYINIIIEMVIFTVLVI